jgi:hypothetical protein
MPRSYCGACSSFGATVQPITLSPYLLRTRLQFGDDRRHGCRHGYGQARQNLRAFASVGRSLIPKSAMHIVKVDIRR